FHHQKERNEKCSMIMGDKTLLRKRTFIKTINGQVKKSRQKSILGIVPFVILSLIRWLP
ncbi:MAG: hypothetical protein ACI9DJ_001247, partial [Algoriphagus sp.]